MCTCGLLKRGPSVIATRRKPEIKKGLRPTHKKFMILTLTSIEKSVHPGNILIIGVFLYFMPSYRDPMSHMYCEKCDRRYPTSFTNCTICNGKLVAHEYVE